MNPVIIIPTYVGGRQRSLSDKVVGTYDHVTPITHQGELPRCLDSLRSQSVRAPVMLLVVSDDNVDDEAGDKIRGIAEGYSRSLNILVVDAPILARLHNRMAALGADQMIEGIGLRGYGAIRNLGLLAADLLGFTEIVFIDDDEIVSTPDFIDRALYGLGRLSPNGVPILVKSGYYTDTNGSWRSLQNSAWYNRFWGLREAFNQWMGNAMASARLSTSNILNGGCMALHREAFIRIAFDAWISRGEDQDYLLNILMYGGRVWFDNEWSVIHRPPPEFAEGQRFRQDIYRWTYEIRKLEYARSQIDLLQIQPSTLDPYPGPFLEKSVTRRAMLTALLRTIGRPRDRQGYLRAAMAAPKDAQDYALEFCSRYFEFQRLWASFVAEMETDPESRQILEASLLEPSQSGEPVQSNEPFS